MEYHSTPNIIYLHKTNLLEIELLLINDNKMFQYKIEIFKQLDSIQLHQI